MERGRAGVKRSAPRSGPVPAPVRDPVVRTLFGTGRPSLTYVHVPPYDWLRAASVIYVVRYLLKEDPVD